MKYQHDYNMQVYEITIHIGHISCNEVKTSINSSQQISNGIKRIFCLLFFSYEGVYKVFRSSKHLTKFIQN